MNTVVTGERRRKVTQAPVSPGTATSAGAGLRIAGAVERAKEARKAFPEIRECRRKATMLEGAYADGFGNVSDEAEDDSGRQGYRRGSIDA